MVPETFKDVLMRFREFQDVQEVFQALRCFIGSHVSSRELRSISKRFRDFSGSFTRASEHP